MNTMDWHLDTETIESYRRGDVSPAMAASLETHVIACDECRRLVSDHADTQRTALNWSAIADQIDAPRRNVVEQVLGRLGLRDHIARLMVLTPAFRVAWIGGVAVVTAMAIVASSNRSVLRGDRGSFAFLVLAPLLPVLGVAAAFARRSDPAYELTVAAPFAAFELLLIRAAAVVVSSTVASAIASVGLPVDLATAAVWLLPALGLTTATLALARWIPVAAGAGALSTLWLLAAVLAARSDSAARLIAQYPPFEPAGQAAFFVLALVASASVAASRHSFDLRRTA